MKRDKEWQKSFKEPQSCKSLKKVEWQKKKKEEAIQVWCGEEEVQVLLLSIPLWECLRPSQV